MVNDPNGQDLLSQIAASDKVEVAPKKEQSIFMMLLVRIMRMTLQFDEFRRKNPLVFGFLGGLWALLVTVLYIGGIAAMVVLIYSYRHFPLFVQDYFKQNKIAVKQLNIDDYDFSKIEVRDLTDPAGTYQIKKVTIYSSFSEFLRHRVKAVVIDGVTMKITETKDGLNFGNLPQVLARLNQTSGGNKIHINTLSVMNAQLDFDGQKLKLPITFSLTGAYDKGTKLTVPFSVKQENVKLAGALSVSGSAREMSWTVDVSSGTLSMPDSYPENITANLVFKTKQMDLIGVSGNVRLSYGKNVKAIQVNLTKKESEFQGNVTFDIVNQNAGTSEESKTNVDLAFDGLKIPTLSRLETDKPIRLSVQSFARENISLSDLSGELTGKLVCEGLSCSYSLAKPAPMTMRNLKLTMDGVPVQSTQPVRFNLVPPTRKATPLVSYATNKLVGNGSLQQVVFNGFMREKGDTVIFSMEKGAFTVEQDSRRHSRKLALQVIGVDYETKEQQVKGGALTSGDVLAEKPVIRMEADSVTLKNNPLIRAPFKLSVDRRGADSKALLSFVDGKVNVALNGKLMLRAGEFSGEVFMHPVQLAQLPQPLSQLSDFFPRAVENVSGTMGVWGNLNWKNTKQIGGPLFVAFKDTNFKSGNLQVTGLNTVLLFQSLEPFVTPAPQTVFVSEIGGPFRLQNVSGQIKLESQLMRLTSLYGQAGGLDLRMDPIIIPYKTENITMYLRNSAFKFDTVDKMLADSMISLSGNGSINIPVRYDKGLFAIRNGEFKISNGYIGYTGDDKSLKSSMFHNTSKIYVQSGNGTFNSAGDGDIYSLYLNLDARVPGTQDKFRVKETVTGVLGKLLKPVETAPVPEVISSKQTVIIK